jgi:hypothetical protein
MDELTVQLTVEKVADADRDALTGELQSEVESVSPGVAVSRLSDGRRTLDAGTIIQIVLNAGALVAIAKGIADWLRMHQGAEIKIECRDGTKVEAKTVTSATALSVIEAALRASEGKKKKK